MFNTFPSCARLIGAAGSSLALAGVAALPVQASTADAAPQATAAAPAADVNAQIVVRDAATGKLRAPTAEEARALTSQTDGLRRSPPKMLGKTHASGARGARLTDEFASYTVMVRQPDGRLVEQCFETREAAEAAVKAASIGKTTLLPTE